MFIFIRDYKIYESARCDVWVKLGVVVVSETSVDEVLDCENVKYEDLVKKVKSEVRKWDWLNGIYVEGSEKNKSLRKYSELVRSSRKL